MKEFSPNNIGVIERPESKSKLAQVNVYASSERFSAIPAGLKATAIKHAAFFAEASDAMVNHQLKELYKNPAYGGFNQHEKENKDMKWGSLEEVNKKYGDMFDEKVEEDGLSPQEASAYCRKQKRMEVASRVARNDFAKELNYLPGPDGKPGKNDYKSITENPIFRAADSLVLLAVQRFT